MEKCGESKGRDKLFSYLDDIIALSHGKATTERGNKDQSKQGWARVLISAIATYGALLKDVELDELKLEVEEIKKALQK